MPDIAHSQFVHRSPVDRKHQPDNGPVITVSPLQDEEPSHYESVNESHKQGERIPCRPWPSLGGIAIDVALSHHDKKTRAAILTKGTVQVYDLNLETFDVTLCKNYTVTHQLENARITLSGPFLAVWGFCKQQMKKLVLHVLSSSSLFSFSFLFPLISWPSELF
jgi:hypothetical protein